MKVLSQTSKYGIRALLYIVSNPSTGEYVSIGEITKELNLSFHFLTKIFRELTNKGILYSYRGPSGGIALAKPSDQIMLIDIVLALEGEDYFDNCLLGFPGCGVEKPCPVHNFWKGIKEDIKSHLCNTSLAQLGEKILAEEVRLFD
ncbi:RrF2 family transcriptional regulator [Cecembia lonarensis]|uniref:HTH-type transcriptional repressor NsrR n=1 Tax=Cecembia lonarensis (strain CCUG 58316 / KCTC 22772 / LW9) TaxID=1225176 RepID=K1LCJ6_CECL9|nr:Rrf2 family transcriptional regulator [Cecembia lonarensis]EKB49952.1 HTH-type transcriptional repressor NsrR [Cecembia lonarensis LW9]